MEENFNKNGFVLLKGIIPKQLLNKSYEEIEDFINQQYELYGFKKKITLDKKIETLFNLDKIYRKHIYQALSTQMLTPFEIGNFLKPIVKRYGIKIPVHRGGAAHVFHLPNEDHFLTEVHQDIGIMLSDKSLTCWYPLVPINKENGRLRLYPGSHKLGVVRPYKINYRGHSEIKSSIINKFDYIEFDMNPSDLIIFSTKLLHTATPNRSSNCRFASIIRFEDYSEKEFHNQLDSRFSHGYIMEKDKSTLSGFKENQEDLIINETEVASEYKKNK